MLGIWQVCDFGYSKHEKYQSAPGSRVGTPAYLAPEVIMTTKGKTYDGKVRRMGACCSWQPSWGWGTEGWLVGLYGTAGKLESQWLLGERGLTGWCFGL